MTFERIIKEDDIVRIVTVENEVFVGRILPNFFVIKENDELDTEIFLSQTPEHTGKDYGTVGLPIRFIKSIYKL